MIATVNIRVQVKVWVTDYPRTKATAAATAEKLVRESLVTDNRLKMTVPPKGVVVGVE